MKKHVLSIAFAATAFIFPLQTFAFNLGAAGDFNTFILEDFISSYSDTEGRLAVGGNATLTGYGIGQALPENSEGSGLVVGGDLTYNGGQIFHGDVSVGGTLNQANMTIADGTLKQGGTLEIDFDAEAAYMRTLADQLAEHASTGTVENNYGGLYLSGTKGNSLQVFNLDGEDLLNAHTFMFDTTSIDDDATVIFNVSGTKTGLTNMSLASLASINQNVLFNFYEATELTFAGIGIEGSVLAPWAEVETPVGQINGTMIAKSWDASNPGGLEQHYVSFSGDLPNFPTVVPEPSTLLLLSAGILGLFGAKRRPKK